MVSTIQFAARGGDWCGTKPNSAAMYKSMVKKLSEGGYKDQPNYEKQALANLVYTVKNGLPFQKQAIQEAVKEFNYQNDELNAALAAASGQ